MMIGLLLLQPVAITEGLCHHTTCPPAPQFSRGVLTLSLLSTANAIML